MYKVIKLFTDLQDNGHVYKVGDVYPREGKVVTDARIDMLSTSKNRQGVPLIVKMDGRRKENAVESLNPASPAQSEMVGQEASSEEYVKPKKSGNRKSKKD